VGAQADEIDKQALNFGMRVDRQQANINQGRISRIETQLDDIKEKKLRSYPNEDIQQLQLRG